MSGENSLIPPSIHPGLLVDDHVIASQVRARQCMRFVMQCLAVNAAKTLASTGAWHNRR